MVLYMFYHDKYHGFIMFYLFFLLFSLHATAVRPAAAISTYLFHDDPDDLDLHRAFAAVC